MNNTIQISLQGQDTIDYLIRNLDDFDKDKAVRKGLGEGADVFKSGGMQRLRSRLKTPGGKTGNLLHSFTARVKRQTLGALAGFNYLGRHSHLVDRGTVRRFRRNGATTGIMPANYFWTETKDQDAGKALNKVLDGIEMAVERINARQ